MFGPRRNLLSVLMLLALAGAVPLRAVPPSQLSEFTHHAWHVQDGLPDQVVQAIAQTADHYLWIGTTKGLLRFDGHTFEPYTGDGSFALRHGVTCLLVARDGSLYIGTEGGGLLHLARGRMELFGMESGIANLLIRSLVEDRDGHLWVGTDRGLFRSSSARKGRFIRVEPLALYDNLGSAALLIDRSGAVWSGGSRLLRIRGGDLREYTLPQQNGSMRIKAICAGADGSIWVGSVAGLFHQLRSGRFVKVEGVEGSVRTIGRMSSGEIWAGTAGDGLFVQHNGHFDHIRAPGVLPSNTILSQATDGDGNVWLGTQSGLLRLSRTGMRLTTLPGALDSDFGTLMLDRDGSLWICSSQLFRMSNGKTERYSFPGLGSITVRAMLREPSGALWLGTSGRGAYRIAPSGSIAHYTYQIGTNYIRSFLPSPEGGVWIGTDGGVSYYRNGIIDDDHEIPGAPHTLTLAMAEDRDRRLWIGTERGLFTLRQGAFESLAVADKFREEAIWSLLADPDGTLWIGADSGLYRLRNGRLTHLPLNTEAPTQAVYQILEDPRGIMWIAGPTRVLRIERSSLERLADDRLTSDPSSFAPEIFPVSTEIQSAEIYGGMQPAGLVAPDGTAWFATSQGPLHLIPHQQPKLKDVPLVIEHVFVDGRTIDRADALDLPAGARTLRIDYAPVELSSQICLRFRHRLQGFDDWSPATYSRTAVYTNLPPGSYRFQAQVLYNQSVSSAELPILQRAFFYRKPWFWAFCFLCLVAAAWTAYRARVHRIQMHFRTIAAERNRLAREMHDTVIQGCTAVSALLEAVSSTNPAGAPGATLLNVAREQIRTTIHEARDAVWNLRSNETASRELAPSLNKLLDQCARSSGITPSFAAEGPEPPLDPATTHELLMSTREALLNAAAHSAATRIDLRLRCTPRDLTITIADNGSGFDLTEAAAGSDRHYGLTGMRERIESIGGSFHLATSTGGGTRLIFHVPRATLERHRPAPLEA